MGHSHHFLSRLDRVNLQETELALSFYRDPALLEAVINRSKLPERAERVAVSLSEGNSGPYVIVTRDAKFVTCLASGMDPGDLPVIPRAQLDAIATHVVELRQKLRLCADLAQEKTQFFGLLEELHTAGDGVTRETMETLLATQPVLGKHFLELWTEHVDEIDGRIRAAAKIKQPRGNDLERLREVWQRAWRIQHISILITSDWLRESFEQTSGDRFYPGFVWQFATFDTGSFTARNLWGVARFGKPALGPIKRMLPDWEKSPNMQRAIRMALAALGVRHAKLRAEILKVLEPPVGTPDDSVAATFYRYAQGTLFAPDELKDTTPYLLRKVFEPALPALTQLGLIASPVLEEVPLDVVVPAMLIGDEPLVGEKGTFFQLCMSLASICRSEATAMYLPERWSKHLVKPWNVARSRGLIERYMQNFPSPQPKRASERPGRNEACSCGSGRKYKKCCG